MEQLLQRKMRRHLQHYDFSKKTVRKCAALRRIVSGLTVIDVPAALTFDKNADISLAARFVLSLLFPSQFLDAAGQINQC